MIISTASVIYINRNGKNIMSYIWHIDRVAIYYFISMVNISLLSVNLMPRKHKTGFQEVLSIAIQ